MLDLLKLKELVGIALQKKFEEYEVESVEIKDSKDELIIKIKTKRAKELKEKLKEVMENV